MTRERRGYVRITCEVAERGRIDARVAEDDQAMSVDDINDIEQRADRCEPVARAAEIDRGAEQTDGHAAGIDDRDGHGDRGGAAGELRVGDR